MSEPRITLTVSPELTERFDRIAELRGTSRSRLLESLVEIGVQQEEKTMKTLGNPAVGPIVQMSASAIGEKLSPDEYATRQAAGPAIKKIRGTVGDKRGRRIDLRPEGT